jgi:stage II sporulation protein D
MRRAATTLVLLALLIGGLPASSGNAATTFTFYGSGWGHGVGMGQWGGNGLAQKGWTYKQILRHFYQGTTVGQGSSLPKNLRIGLVQDASLIRVTAVAGTVEFRLGTPSGTLVGGRPIPVGQTWTVRTNNNGRYRVFDAGGTLVGDCAGCSGHVWGGPGQNLILRFSNGGRATIPEAGATYNRGRIEFNTYSGSCGGLSYCIRLIAILPLQAYLYGVAEVPNGWPVHIRRAQAVASRTYAVEKAKRLGQNRPGCNCALFDDTRDQSYVGWNKEGGSLGANWVQAVDDTNGVVVMYGGALIQAFFHSSTGGMSESVQFVFGSNLPYLQSRCDPGDFVAANPNRVWTVGPLSDTEVTSRLQSRTGNIGTVTGFTGITRGHSGRIVQITVQGKSGQKTLSGSNFARGLGLKDDRVWINQDRQVTGGIRAKYDDLMCSPGLPSSAQGNVPGGTRQRFVVGAIYWNDARGAAYWLFGPVYAKYQELGESGGSLGMPRSDISTTSGGDHTATFENGTITCTSSGSCSLGSGGGGGSGGSGDAMYRIRRAKPTQSDWSKPLTLDQLSARFAGGVTKKPSPYRIQIVGRTGVLGPWDRDTFLVRAARWAKGMAVGEVMKITCGDGTVFRVRRVS